MTLKPLNVVSREHDVSLETKFDLNLGLKMRRITLNQFPIKKIAARFDYAAFAVTCLVSAKL